MKKAAALSVVLMATAVPLAWQTSPALAGSVAVRSAQRTGPDACGYRHAIWGVAQQTAAYISKVADGSISDTYTAGMENAYINEQEIDMGPDYDFPQWRKIVLITAQITSGGLYNAVQAGSYSSSFNDFLIIARKGQTKLWAAIKAICPSNGPGFTWTGYVNKYGLASGKVYVHVPHAWELDWDFNCGAQKGNFIANVQSGSYYKQATNSLTTNGAGYTPIKRGGSFTISVISECAWRVKATNQ